MLTAIVSSFALVAVSEMGDKTQLLAFALASRFKKPWIVMAGILVATIFNHALASTVGQTVAQYLPPKTMSFLLAGLFFAFALWTLKPDTLDEEKNEPRWGAFVTTTVLFFLAEMGDKTQLATVALGARYSSAIAVTLGTTAGMLVSDGLAVFLGEKLAESEKTMKWVRWIAAGVFALFGVLSVVAALHL